MKSNSRAVLVKTKAILILLLALFLCVRPNAGFCICPSEAEQVVKEARMVAASVDTCNECGHKKDCCLKQSEMRASAACSLSAAPLTALNQLDICAIPITVNIATATCVALSAVDNKAPPWSSQTLVSLQRKLLI